MGKSFIIVCFKQLPSNLLVANNMKLMKRYFVFCLLFLVFVNFSKAQETDQENSEDSDESIEEIFAGEPRKIKTEEDVYKCATQDKKCISFLADCLDGRKEAVDLKFVKRCLKQICDKHTEVRSCKVIEERKKRLKKKVKGKKPKKPKDPKDPKPTKDPNATKKPKPPKGKQCDDSDEQCKCKKFKTKDERRKCLHNLKYAVCKRPGNTLDECLAGADCKDSKRCIKTAIQERCSVVECKEPTVKEKVNEFAVCKIKATTWEQCSSKCSAITEKKDSKTCFRKAKNAFCQAKVSERAECKITPGSAIKKEKKEIDFSDCKIENTTMDQCTSKCSNLQGKRLNRCNIKAKKEYCKVDFDRVDCKVPPSKSEEDGKKKKKKKTTKTKKKTTKKKKKKE